MRGGRPHDVRRNGDRRVSATGLLRTFTDAEVIESSDVHVAQRLTALAKEADETVALAVALVVRALRGGSVCVDLRSVERAGRGRRTCRGRTSTSGWRPCGPARWRGRRPCCDVDGELLYLDRYWLEEQQVCRRRAGDGRRRRPTQAAPTSTGCSPRDTRSSVRPRKSRCRKGLTVLTGGPGTGKTTTVARLLALLAEQAGGALLRIALAAPTGKAAARLQEAVQLEVDKLEPADRQALAGLHATTLHRLLRQQAGHVGAVPPPSRQPVAARRDRRRRDVDGVADDDGAAAGGGASGGAADAGRRPGPAGVGGSGCRAGGSGRRAWMSAKIAALKTSHRFGESIGALATAIRDGDADRVDRGAARRRRPHRVDRGDEPREHLRKVLVPHALALREAAMLGDGEAALATLDEHRLLCAHRRGPYGVRHWNRQVERWLTEATGEPIWSAWYAGRPILVTANDYGLGLYNGDTGVTVVDATGLRAVDRRTGEPLEFATSRLADVETMHAMTIHKSQGSQADEVTVLMPPEDSRLLTRELFYTAVTRAKKRCGWSGRKRRCGRRSNGGRCARPGWDDDYARAVTMKIRIHPILMEERPSRYGLTGFALSLTETSRRRSKSPPKGPENPTSADNLRLCIRAGGFRACRFSGDGHDSIAECLVLVPQLPV